MAFHVVSMRLPSDGKARTMRAPAELERVAELDARRAPLASSGAVPTSGAHSRSKSKLGQARALRKLGQAELAEESGVPLRTLQRLESGKLGDRIQFGQLAACAAALGYPIEDLIESEWLERELPNGTTWQVKLVRD